MYVYYYRKKVIKNKPFKSGLLTKLTIQAVLVIELVKTYSKITLSKKYVNINQYIISRYEVFAKLFSNNVRLQCKRKLSQVIALFGSSQFNICCSFSFQVLYLRV